MSKNKKTVGELLRDYKRINTDYQIAREIECSVSDFYMQINTDLGKELNDDLANAMELTAKISNYLYSEGMKVGNELTKAINKR